MKRPAFVALCLLAVVCAGLLLRHGKEPAGAEAVSSSSGSSSPAPAAAASHMNERRAAEAQVSPGELAAPAPARSPEEKEQRFAAINAAATTYAPEGIKDIKPFLLDPDPEIRAAAKDGLIVLSEAGGAAPLRAAAKQLKDPREAAAYLEAADFLELPSWSETEEARADADPFLKAPAPEQQ